VAGDRDRAGNLLVVRTERGRRADRRQGSLEFRPWDGIGRDDHRLGAAAALHCRYARLRRGGARPATEWTVEARDGGTCVVRVVHRWFAESDAWDDQFVGHTYGWQAFFRILRLYLSRLDGRPLVPLQAVGFAPEPKEAAWASVTSALGIENATLGDRVHSRAGAPRLAGTVEWAGQPEAPEDLLIRLDEPAPGIAHLVAHSMGGQVLLTVRLYLLRNAAGEASRWQEWLDERAEQQGPAR
jgi:hypothetical protein